MGQTDQTMAAQSLPPLCSLLKSMRITGSPGAFYYLPGSGLGTNKWVVYFQVSLCRPFCAPTPGPGLALCPPAATPHANHCMDMLRAVHRLILDMKFTGSSHQCCFASIGAWRLLSGFWPGARPLLWPVYALPKGIKHSALPLLANDGI